MKRVLLVALLAAVSACRSAPEQPASSPAKHAGHFEWPVPEGWRAETIPFPLAFAPQIPLSGVEELRFPPGMFKADAPLYFSYAFVFWLEGEPTLDEPALERTLRDYFVGLTSAVAESRQLTLDTQTISAQVERASGTPAVRGHPVSPFTGTVSTYDPFSTGAPLNLTVQTWIWTCPESQRRVAMFIASPQEQTSAAWDALSQRRDEFRCH